MCLTSFKNENVFNTRPSGKIACQDSIERLHNQICTFHSFCHVLFVGSRKCCNSFTHAQSKMCDARRRKGRELKFD